MTGARSRALWAGLITGAIIGALGATVLSDVSFPVILLVAVGLGLLVGGVLRRPRGAGASKR